MSTQPDEQPTPDTDVPTPEQPDVENPPTPDTENDGTDADE